MMERLKVHRIVEYIRTVGEFPFEVEDVDDNLADVLGYFGFEVVALTAQETDELQRELRALAWAEQNQEVALLAEQALTGP